MLPISLMVQNTITIDFATFTTPTGGVRVVELVTAGLLLLAEALVFLRRK